MDNAEKQRAHLNQITHDITPRQFASTAISAPVSWKTLTRPAWNRNFAFVT